MPVGVDSSSEALWSLIMLLFCSLLIAVTAAWASVDLNGVFWQGCALQFIPTGLIWLLAITASVHEPNRAGLADLLLLSHLPIVAVLVGKLGRRYALAIVLTFLLAGFLSFAGWILSSPDFL